MKGAVANPVKSLARRVIGRVLDEADERRRLDQATSPATKAALRSLQHSYRRSVEAGAPLPSVWETGFRVFSQFDEDGVGLFLLSVAGVRSGRFVDIGSADGLWASNCANLALNHGFHGLFVDAREHEVEKGRRFYAAHPDTRERPPAWRHAFLTRENINDVIREAGLEGEVDLLSIDVDGNDYWLWDALEAVSPRVVVIETHTEYGLEDYVAPYVPDFDWHSAPAGTRIGASAVAMTRLARGLGYRLVGANLYGFNTFYARNDVGSDLLEELSVEELFRHGSYREAVA
jgi:hypothetical protein